MIVVTLERWLEPHAPRFLENRKKDLDTLAGALAASDFAAVRSVGHNLRGIAPGFGMAPLGEVGVELEAAAHEEDADKVRACMLKIGRYLATVRIVYR